MAVPATCSPPASGQGVLSTPGPESRGPPFSAPGPGFRYHARGVEGLGVNPYIPRAKCSRVSGSAQGRTWAESGLPGSARGHRPLSRLVAASGAPRHEPANVPQAGRP